MKPILVTGVMRSGTTLLQRLLSGHRRLQIHFQPFPGLYVDAKRRYLEATGRHDPQYPLSDQFAGTWFPHHELADFLAETRFSAEDVFRALQGQMPFAGTAYPRVEEVLDATEPARTLGQWVDRLLDSSRRSDEVIAVGSKEVCVEELAPHFLDRGYRVLCVLRDPRNVVASAEAGAGGPHVGRRRPLLFLIRQWRKSVAYAQYLRTRANFLALRFEDLVTAPETSLARVGRFLEVDPADFDLGSIANPDGTPWASNSSFGARSGIDPRAADRPRTLEPELGTWIEALTLPELRHLDYPIQIRKSEVEEVLLGDGPEESPVERPALSEYTWTPARSAEEVDRWRALTSSEYREELFLDRDVFDGLRLQVGGPST